MTKVPHRVDVDLSVDALVEQGTEGSDFAEDLYQIIGEAVHNAVKHALPTKVLVDAHLNSARSLVRIDVVDDGCGLPSNATAHDGFGLASMRDRATRWGGSITVTAARTGPGTRIRAELPVPGRQPGTERKDAT